MAKTVPSPTHSQITFSITIPPVFITTGRRGPYLLNSSDTPKMRPTGVAFMQSLRWKKDSFHPRPTFLIVGPDTPDSVIDLFCEYEGYADIRERIPCTDPRVGAFSPEGEFVPGMKHGEMNGKPIFLLDPRSISENDDVVTLNYYADEEGGSVLAYTALVDHPTNDDDYDDYDDYENDDY